MTRAAALLVLCALSATASVAAAQSNKGRIRGVVTDKTTHEPLAGVTVTATSSALQGDQPTQVTDDLGQYTLEELPPGRYRVVFELGDAREERTGVELSAEETLVLSAELAVAPERPPPPPEAKLETAAPEPLVTATVAAPAPRVDLGSAAQKTVFDHQLTRRTPVRGRTYASLLADAPGAAPDGVGFSFGGATGAENRVMIEGLDTTHPLFGVGGTPLSLELIEETQVVTMGFSADQGRVTGGAVNVVTKSGSNDWQGSIFATYTPFQLEGRGGAQPTYLQLDFGGTLGGPVIEDRLWFFAGVVPIHEKARFVLPSGSEDFASHWLVSYLGRLDLRIADGHTVTLQYIGAPSRFDGGRSSFELRPALREVEERYGAHDVIASASSRLIENRLRLDARAGYHWEDATIEPRFDPALAGESRADRVSAGLAVTLLGRFGGEHELELGGDVMLDRYRTSDTELSTFRQAIYLTDSWRLGFFSGFMLEAGVRLDLEQLQDTGLAFSDSLAPRVGFTYDWSLKGLSKVFAHYGRMYQALPLSVNAQLLDRDRPTTALPTLRGQFVDNITGGFEVHVSGDLVMGASYVHADYRRVIEDVSVDRGQTFTLANPGQPLSADPIERSVPRPTRDYNAMVIHARKRFTDRWLVQASYTFSRTLGSYPGLYDDATGELAPNTSSLLDLPELAANLDGALPNDRPHNFKIQIGYFIPTEGRDGDGLNVGVRMTLISGAPIDVRAPHPTLGAGQTLILPRGAGGRMPMLSSVDVLASYTFGPVELSASVFNVLNLRTPIAVDTTYTDEPVLPIVNGGEEDLATLKNTDGQPVVPSPRFRQPIAFQEPLFMRLGLRLEF